MTCFKLYVVKFVWTKLDSDTIEFCTKFKKNDFLLNFDKYVIVITMSFIKSYNKCNCKFIFLRWQEKKSFMSRFKHQLSIRIFRFYRHRDRLLEW